MGGMVENLKLPKIGSRWFAVDGAKFRVINTVFVENNQWVHYIKENQEPSQEYSCYLESFLIRFTEIPK